MGAGSALSGAEGHGQSLRKLVGAVAQRQLVLTSETAPIDTHSGGCRCCIADFHHVLGLPTKPAPSGLGVGGSRPNPCNLKGAGLALRLLQCVSSAPRIGRETAFALVTRAAHPLLHFQHFPSPSSRPPTSPALLPRASPDVTNWKLPADGRHAGLGPRERLGPAAKAPAHSCSRAAALHVAGMPRPDTLLPTANPCLPAADTSRIAIFELDPSTDDLQEVLLGSSAPGSPAAAEQAPHTVDVGLIAVFKAPGDDSSADLQEVLLGSRAPAA